MAKQFNEEEEGRSLEDHVNDVRAISVDPAHLERTRDHKPSRRTRKLCGPLEHLEDEEGEK